MMLNVYLVKALLDLSETAAKHSLGALASKARDAAIALAEQDLLGEFEFEAPETEIEEPAK